TDFADHDYIGVLPQNGAQSRGEIQFDTRVYLYLPDARQIVLDGIFYRQNVCRRGVEAAECGVERRTFPATRWAGDKHDSVRPMYQMIQRRHHVGLHAQTLEFEESCLFIEQAQHGAFAMP